MLISAIWAVMETRHKLSFNSALNEIMSWISLKSPDSGLVYCVKGDCGYSENIDLNTWLSWSSISCLHAGENFHLALEISCFFKKCLPVMTTSVIIFGLPPGWKGT